VQSRFLIAAAYGSMLASIFLTRVFRLFTVADVLSVAAFVCAALLLRIRWSQLEAAEKTLVAGALVGLSGVLVKLVLAALGIPDVPAGADHTYPGLTGSDRLFMHIHHLFFNAGFLLYLIAALLMLLRKFRA